VACVDHKARKTIATNYESLLLLLLLLRRKGTATTSARAARKKRKISNSLVNSGRLSNNFN
jgi:hypothetical protein